jgi:hypothetical protein
MASAGMRRLDDAAHAWTVADATSTPRLRQEPAAAALQLGFHVADLK